jgi:DNA-binding MarR family transcriptional regulator
MAKPNRDEVAERATGGMKRGPKQGKKRKNNRLEAVRHPLRARVLRTLVERGIMSPAELSRELHADLSDVSYHVQRLEALGCAELVRTQPVRGALEHFYRATERHLVDTSEFEELDSLTAEAMLSDSVQRTIDDVVVSFKAKMVAHDQYFHITRTPMILDEAGLQEALELYERCRLEMVDVECRSAERRANSNVPGVPVSSNLLCFKVPRSSLNT